MLNPDRIRAKLQDISGSLERLDRFRTMSREAFLADEDAQDIARSRLLTAIEAALNICFHLSAKKLAQVPEGYAECFLTLGKAGLVEPSLAKRLGTMAGFRNRLVHVYWDVDYGQVYDIIINDLKDLELFCREVAELL